MQTIGDLNKKILYRIIKVLYFGAFLFILLIAGILIYEDSTYYPYDETKTHIGCVGGYTGVDISKSTYGISGDSLTLEQKREIAKDICGVDPISIDSFEFIGERSLLLSKNNFFTASQGVMEESIHITVFVEYFLAVLFGLLILFELLRRIFYYITFGTFRPKK